MNGTRMCVLDYTKNWFQCIPQFRPQLDVNTTKLKGVIKNQDMK